ncbi:MAG: alpha/beta hydrolase [Acidobacteriota bacterium]|nr:alpha/beta hydrolase [Acidobacteriota bacterium]
MTLRYPSWSGAARVARAATVVLMTVASTSCALYYRAGIGLLYRKAELPASRVILDVPYAGPGSTASQRLNLFLPERTGWPLVVFVHGGSWDEGSKDLRVGGADIYNNIGRYLAANGIGVAVAGYRLLPHVTWQTQTADVAAAVHWAGAHAAEYGARPGCVFVMGHSAGAQLAVRTALAPASRGAGGETLPPICGVIGVSGAGYDLADQRTYDLGNDPRFYEKRFGGAPGWQRAASPITFVSSDTVSRIPFLLLYAGGETKALQRQTQLLHDTLRGAGASSTLVVVPGESHSRIVLTLSRGDKTAGPAIVEFVMREHQAALSRDGRRPSLVPPA